MMKHFEQRIPDSDSSLRDSAVRQLRLLEQEMLVCAAFTELTVQRTIIVQEFVVCRDDRRYWSHTAC